MASLVPWLFVTGDFVKTGGMDIANYMLAQHLAQRGHEVHLVGHRAAAELLELPSVHFHRLPKLLNSYLLAGPPRPVRAALGPEYHIAWRPRSGQWRQLFMGRH